MQQYDLLHVHVNKPLFGSIDLYTSILFCIQSILSELLQDLTDFHDLERPISECIRTILLNIHFKRGACKNQEVYSVPFNIIYRRGISLPNLDLMLLNLKRNTRLHNSGFTVYLKRLIDQPTCGFTIRLTTYIHKHIYA